MPNYLMKEIKLEVIIVPLICIIFLILNSQIEPTSKIYINSSTNISKYNNSNLDVNYIIQEMHKTNSSKKEIENIIKQDDFVKQKKLDEKNKIFEQLVNEIKNESK